MQWPSLRWQATSGTGAQAHTKLHWPCAGHCFLNIEAAPLGTVINCRWCTSLSGRPEQSHPKTQHLASIFQFVYMRDILVVAGYPSALDLPPWHSTFNPLLKGCTCTAIRSVPRPEVYRELSHVERCAVGTTLCSGTYFGVIAPLNPFHLIIIIHHGNELSSPNQ